MPSYLLKLAEVGGQGGSSFNHRQQLLQHGLVMGCGSSFGVRLSSIHVKRHRVLSHLQASYSSCSQLTAQAPVRVKGTGNIRSTADAVDITIAADERVEMVGVEHGFMSWAAGAICLNHLRFTLRSVDGSRRVSSIGPSHFPNLHEQPCKAANIQVVAIPEGLTLAGLGGRAGDSWDQISLFVTPWLPGGAAWSTAMHRHCPPPFKQQVRTLLLCLSRWGEQVSASSHDTHSTHSNARLPPGVADIIVAALFKQTFFSGDVHLPDAAGADADNDGLDDDFIGSWMKQQVQLAIAESSSRCS